MVIGIGVLLFRGIHEKALETISVHGHSEGKEPKSLRTSHSRTLAPVIIRKYEILVIGERPVLLVARGILLVCSMHDSNNNVPVCHSWVFFRSSVGP